MPMQRSTRQHTKQDSIHLASTPKDKKRHLFRFGRKKSRSEIPSENTQKEDTASIITNGSTLTEKRKKSEASNYSKDEKIIELDQNFNTMEGIVKPEYKTEKTLMPQEITDSNGGHWLPPGSWAVQPADDEDSTGYFPVVEHETWKVPDKNYGVRIFRQDNTFATLILPLNTTANDLVQRLAGKLFLQDLGKYRLKLVRNNLEREIQPYEQPIKIQKKLLEQIGYTDEDRIEELGREDNSYLYRFHFGTNSISFAQDNERESNTSFDYTAKNLSSVPVFLYKCAAEIKTLNLSKNPMIEIPVEFLQLCKSLQHLWLSDNGYNNLPASIRLIPNIEYLNISGNKIVDLTHSRLHEIISLTSLRAFNNRMTSLPDDFAKFKNLTALYISNNLLTVFPKVICSIRSLSNLDISFNRITSFPEEIGNLTNLTFLFAIANRLDGSLPQAFSKLINLKGLDIRQNQITDMEVLHDLQKLERISVDYNSMSVVNYGFKHLKRLMMSKNHLTQFTIINDQCLLTDLNLSNCKLPSLPDDIFIRVPSLESLNLDSNTLAVLPNSITVLTKLQRLSVKSNNLDALPSDISRLTHLRTLDVQNNNLKAIPRDIWLCGFLNTLNCSSNLLEAFPEPYASSSLHSNSQIVFHTGQGKVPPISEPTHPFDTSNIIQPSNFNPPSFFGNPRNHPPPLSLTLRFLYLGDNRLTDDIWSPISLFTELRTLNLSFNDLYEIPLDGLCHLQLYELYLSGNHLASLPADDIERLSFLRVLAVNGNKLQTLPAEIGKLRKLLVLDVGNNVLKYNISNWPYDWNWNWNLGLKYLNLSGNKRLEIKPSHSESHDLKGKNLTDFNALSRLRMLGLMDVTILGVSTPEENDDRRVRTSPTEVSGMCYGVADWLGPSDHLSTWDMVMPRFRNENDECLFGLFDSCKYSKSGCKLTHFLNKNVSQFLTDELKKTKQGDTIVSALRRTFLGLEREFGSSDGEAGASGLVCYIKGKRLYMANVGDTLAVLSRNNGQAYEITQKHIPLHPSEISRIRAADGFVSTLGQLNDRIDVSRGFGYNHLIPVVNANPFISTIELEENDEFVIMASKGLWDRMSYQTAVDIARTEKDDLMVAAQKLRDFALTYGANSNVMVMIVGVGDLFNKLDRPRKLRGTNRTATGEGVLMIDEGTQGIMAKNKRRIKDEFPSDSTLARLDKEVPPPTNQVALVFTDIKSSTLLWDTQPENMRSAIKIHDAVMRRTLRSIGGYEVKTEGDAFMVCFQDTVAALLWCFTVQLQLLEADWPAGILETVGGGSHLIYRGLSVRMGIHLGTPVYERNPITKRMDYFGPVVNKASRICNAADGGQICVSSDVIAALRDTPGILGDDTGHLSETRSHPRDIQQLKRLGFHIVEMGEHRLKGLETPEMLSLIFPKQLAGRMELKNQVESVVSATPQTEINEPTFRRQSSSFSACPPVHRKIDASLVTSLSELTVRLESLTTGHLPNSSRAGALFQYSQALHKRVEEIASDEEMLMLIENFIARIENVVSSLYLKKVGRFSNVLEKLGEAIDLDASHILRALQMYSEVEGLVQKSNGQIGRAHV